MAGGRARFREGLKHIYRLHACEVFIGNRIGDDEADLTALSCGFFNDKPGETTLFGLYGRVKGMQAFRLRKAL